MSTFWQFRAKSCYGGRWSNPFFMDRSSWVPRWHFLDWDHPLSFSICGNGNEKIYDNCQKMLPKPRVEGCDCKKDDVKCPTEDVDQHCKLYCFCKWVFPKRNIITVNVIRCVFAGDAAVKVSLCNISLQAGACLDGYVTSSGGLYDRPPASQIVLEIVVLWQMTKMSNSLSISHS